MTILKEKELESNHADEWSIFNVYPAKCDFMQYTLSTK